MVARASYLETSPMTKTKKTNLKAVTKRYRANEFGCRELAKKYTTILKIDSTMGHETAKRVASEVERLP